jgi:hypothetical protein
LIEKLAVLFFTCILRFFWPRKVLLQLQTLGDFWGVSYDAFTFGLAG